MRRRPVLFCSGTGEAAAVAPALSERLEAALGDLRGRRFYGTHDPETCEYVPASRRWRGDPSRSDVEHYRRRDEVDVLMPVLSSGRARRAAAPSAPRATAC